MLYVVNGNSVYILFEKTLDKGHGMYTPIATFRKETLSRISLYQKLPVI